MPTRAIVGTILLAIALVAPHRVHAQGTVTPAPQTSFRGFADVALSTFAAKESFEAILGSATGPVYGGGLEMVVRERFGLSFRIGQLSKSGERVFVHNGQRFGLGIPVKVKVNPIILALDYRFGRNRVVPYLGGGAGVYRYKETSSFADATENVSESFGAYQVQGGVHAKLSRWLGLGGEIRWVTVPNGLGKAGISQDFGEDDLGGLNFALRVTIGR